MLNESIASRLDSSFFATGVLGTCLLGLLLVTAGWVGGDVLHRPTAEPQQATPDQEVAPVAPADDTLRNSEDIARHLRAGGSADWPDDVKGRVDSVLAEMTLEEKVHMRKHRGILATWSSRMPSKHCSRGCQVRPRRRLLSS